MIYLYICIYTNLSHISWDRRDDNYDAGSDELKEQSIEYYGAGIHSFIQKYNIANERNGDLVEN